jgi:amino acid transporter
VACVVVVCIANVLGAEILATAAQIATFITVAPFVLLPIVAAATGARFEWSSDSPPSSLPSPAGGGWAVFGSTILWTFQGWSNIGALAAEVKDPRSSYPRAVFFCLVATVLTYVVPIFFGAALAPDMSQWGEGYWSTLMENTAPWLGVWTLLGAALANFSSGMSATAFYSRFLLAISERGYAPRIFSRTDTTRFATPVPAILFMTASTLALMNVPFENLVVADTLLNLVGIVLVAASFLRLRLRRADLSRPFLVPGGKRIAWALTVVTLGLAVGAAVIVSMGAWPQVVAVIGLAAAAYAWAVWRGEHGEGGGEGEVGGGRGGEGGGDKGGEGLGVRLLLVTGDGG